MQGNNQVPPNLNRFHNNPIPNKYQMEEECQVALIFKPIEKIEIDSTFKQQIVKLQNDVKAFSKNIMNFKFQEKIKQLKTTILFLEKIIEKDNFMDWEQLNSHLEWLKEQYLKKENDFKYHLNVINDMANTQSGDLVNFLKKLSSFEISYQECIPIIFLEQELSCLEIFECVLSPKLSQYKEVLYYEKIDPPIKKYTKNQINNSNSISKNDLNTLLKLLNKYYSFGACPYRQEKYVLLINYTPELKRENFIEVKELIIILEIPSEENLLTYALLNIQQQQNQKICKSISTGKSRNKLLQLSQQLDCNVFTPTLVHEFSLEVAIDELLKLVAPKIKKNDLILFFQENHYLREDKNQNQADNYFVDLFEMERLGFLQCKEQ